VYYFENSFGDSSIWDASCATVVLEVCFDLADAELRYATIPFLVHDISDLNMYPDRMEIVNQISASRFMEQKQYKMIVQEGRGAEVRLQFYNRRGKYFPPSVKVLLVATKFGASRPFKFTLQISPDLQVAVKAKSWWRFWMTKLRPEEGQRGWSCDIEADYCPDLANHILSQDPHRRGQEIIGLHPAAASYLEQLRKPSSF